MVSVAAKASTLGKSARNPWLGLAVLLSAVFMTILDVFIVVVAAPAIRADVGASMAQIQWVVAAYNLAFGALLITGGRLGDLYGRRRVFCVGLTLFVAASLAASMAGTAEALIALRALLGAAAGLLVPQIFSIIQVGFDDAARGKAFGAYASVAGFAATIAQVLGGLLIAGDLFGLGWRLIFLINVPVGALALAAAALIPESRAPHAARHSLDLVGVGLLLLAVLALMLPPSISLERGWGAESLLLLAGFPALGWLFVRWQRRQVARARSPLIEPSLFRNGTFVAGNLLALIFYANNAALFLALPMFLQDGLNHTALTSGLLFAPLALSFSVTSAWVGRLVPRYGHRLVVIGSVLLLASYGLLALAAWLTDVAANAWTLAPGLLLAGIGMGFVPTTINYLGLRHVQAREVGSASGVLNTSFELGYGIGTLLVGAVFFSVQRAVAGWGTSSVSAFTASLVLTAVLILLVLAFARLLGGEGRVGGLKVRESS